jgi:large subunit ribosomal protein L35
LEDKEMPKMKSHSGAKKRFTAKKSGKVKRAKMNKRHILNKKSSKRKMGLRQGTYVDKTQEKTIRKMING